MSVTRRRLPIFFGPTPTLYVTEGKSADLAPRGVVRNASLPALPACLRDGVRLRAVPSVSAEGRLGLRRLETLPGGDHSARRIP